MVSFCSRLLLRRTIPQRLLGDLLNASRLSNVLAPEDRNLSSGNMCCLMMLRKVLKSWSSELVESVVIVFLFCDCWCDCELVEEDDCSSSSSSRSSSMKSRHTNLQIFSLLREKFPFLCGFFIFIDY